MPGLLTIFDGIDGIGVVAHNCCTAFRKRSVWIDEILTEVTGGPAVQLGTAVKHTRAWSLRDNVIFSVFSHTNSSGEHGTGHRLSSLFLNSPYARLVYFPSLSSVQLISNPSSPIYNESLGGKIMDIMSTESQTEIDIYTGSYYHQ